MKVILLHILNKAINDIEIVVYERIYVENCMDIFDLGRDLA